MTDPAVEVVDPFAMVPEALFYSPTSGTAIKVYGALLRHGMDPSNCYPSHRRVATLTHLSEKTVRRSIDELEAGGWVERVARWTPEGDRDSNGYRVFIRPQGGEALVTRPLVTGDQTGEALVTRPCGAGDRVTRANEREPMERERAPDGFDDFWTVYPRKVGKGAARTAYAKALAKTTAAEIHAGAEHYRDALSRTSRPQRYTAHPATWLNQERWDDEPDQEDRPAEPKGWAGIREFLGGNDGREASGGPVERPGHGVSQCRGGGDDGPDVGGRPALGAGGRRQGGVREADPHVQVLPVDSGVLQRGARSPAGPGEP